jgi:uncharacterized protein
MIVNESLKNYIEKNIFPLYENNFIGDGIDRINYVLNRSENIINENNLEVDYDILYTAICFHDLRKDNEEKGHEFVSADIMFNDSFIKKFFSEDQIITIKQAIEDQRANAEKDPRNIYGKILSSASRNSSVKQSLERSYKYGKKKNPNATDDELFENSFNALKNKFGNDGYAKFYFKDSVYEQFLLDIRELLKDKQKFINEQRKLVK